MKFSVIAAVAKNRGIGKNGDLPWRLPEDMKRFVQLTVGNFTDNKQNAVIMGRKTWESIPDKHKPLSKRLNVIVSTTLKTIPDCIVADSFNSALEQVEKLCIVGKVADIWIIGGSSIYEAAINDNRCKAIFLTEIDEEFDCDTHFPHIPFNFFVKTSSDKFMESKNGLKYNFAEYHQAISEKVPEVEI